jgi:hypothetical protein
VVGRVFQAGAAEFGHAARMGLSPATIRDQPAETRDRRNTL